MIVHSESQLVGQQLEGKHEVKIDQLQKYIEAYENLKIEFQEVIFKRYSERKIRKLMSQLEWPVQSLIGLKKT